MRENYLIQQRENVQDEDDDTQKNVMIESYAMTISLNLLGMILTYLPFNEVINLRLISQNFKLAAENSIQKFNIKIINGISWEEFNQFAGKLKRATHFNLPLVLYQDQKFVPCNPVMVLHLQLKLQFLVVEEQELEYLRKQYCKEIIESFPNLISLSISEFKTLQSFENLSTIKELDISKTMRIFNMNIFDNLKHLKSLSLHIHAEDKYFLDGIQDIEFPNLIMLKLKIWGPKIDSQSAQNLINFIDTLQCLEILELEFSIDQNNIEKQDVFDKFLCLPKLRVVMLLNCLIQFKKCALNKIYDELFFNNLFNRDSIDENTITKMQSFAKTIDLCLCKFSEEEQIAIQNIIEKTRQSKNYVNAKIMKFNVQDTLIKSELKLLPYVKKNNKIDTLWQSSYYRI